jgi:1,2-diacylglycerol 3-alpha-glucosyltransferase
MNERLKIGLFIDNFYPAIDGVVIAVDNNAKELSKFNDVVVVAPYEGPNIDDSFRPYKVIRIMSLPVPFSEYRLVGNKSTLSSCYQN